jgi:hypothetical protein
MSKEHAADNDSYGFTPLLEDCMDIRKCGKHGDIAEVNGTGILVHDLQSALDMVAAMWYEAGCTRMVIHKGSLAESFFDLSTRLAGEILQKFVNYNMKVAIVGDFSGFGSKSLKDFIYESNRGNNVFFVATVQDAIERLDRISRD